MGIKLSDDAEVLRNFLRWLSDNNGPYGQISYWIDFYLTGEDASGKKAVNARK